ncbi:MAG: hypothetical protein EU542_09130, partial [Promethearchaeota archaeon]
VLFLFVFGLGGFNTQTPIINGVEVSSLAFTASGIAAMAVLFSGVFGGLGIIRDKLFGFMNELLVAPVSRRTLMIGKTLGVALQTLVQFMLITILSASLGFYGYDLNLIWRVAATIPAGLLFSLGVVGIGMTVSTRLTDFQGFGLIQTFLIMPMFWLSGALILFPEGFRIIMMLNPISYGVDIFRFILLGVSVFPFWLDLLVLTGFGALLISIGAYSFSRMEIN